MRLLKSKISRIIIEQTGFSLFEALVAVSILAFVGVGIVSAIGTNYKASGTLDEQVTAVNFATNIIEAFHETTYAMTYSLDDPPLNTVDVPVHYTVDLETECSADGSTFGPCTGSANQTLQLIQIKIIHDGKPVLRLCTYKTDF